MIGFVRGKIVSVEEKSLCILTEGGVGYDVFTTTSIIASAEPDKVCELYTITIVREDALILFGFKTRDEKKLFLMLTDVDKIGPKLGLAVLSAAPVPNIVGAIISGNAGFFSNISGIGKKTAEKIIIDMKDKVKDFHFAASEITADADGGLKQVTEAEKGLIALGYHLYAVKSVLAKIGNKKDKRAEEIVREALKLIKDHK